MESSSTGSSAKRQSVVCSSTASKAVAPPGGWRQRSRNISAIAAPTATAAAAAGSGSSVAQASPTSAEAVLPPITDQGCASGLAGTANTSTALAPSGAASQSAPA